MRKVDHDEHESHANTLPSVGETVSSNPSLRSEDPRQPQDVVNDDGQRHFGQAGRDGALFGRQAHETGLRPIEQLIPFQMQSLPISQHPSAFGIRDLSSLALRQYTTSLPQGSLQSRISVVNDPLATMHALSQQQQLRGGYSPFRHPAGLSAMDLASSDLNSVLSNHGFLHTRSPYRTNVNAALLLHNEQRQPLGALRNLSRIPPLPSMQQDNAEILQFLAREERLHSAYGYSTYGAQFPASRTDAFLLPSIARLQVPMHQDEFGLNHLDMIRSLPGSSAATTYLSNDSDNKNRGLKRLEIPSSEKSFSHSAKRSKPSDASLSLSPNKGHSLQTPADGIAKFKKRPTSPSPKKRKPAIDLLHNERDLGKISSKSVQASQFSSELDSAGVRFFNNGGEVDLQGRARNTLNDEVEVDSRPTPSSEKSSDQTDEMSELYAYQKSIWSELTLENEGDEAKTPDGHKKKKKKKRRRKSVEKSNRAPKTAGDLPHKDHSFASALDISPGHLSRDPDKIAHAAVEDLVRDSMRERENTLSAASVLMDFLSAGGTQNTKIAKQA